MFESALWRSRFVVVVAVIASLAASLAVFFVATVDVVFLLGHAVEYADPTLAVSAREDIRYDTIAHVVEVVDGYLLGLVLLIFALGMYELFISDIDPARRDRSASRILVIESLDDLKNRLAKVILMILIVSLFDNAIRMHVATPLDLVYVALAIAFVGLAFWLSHAGSGKDHRGKPPEPPH